MKKFDPHHRMVSIKFRNDDYLDLKAAAEKADKPVSNLAREIILDKILDRPGTIKNYIKFLEERVAYNFERISEISPARELEIKVLKGENFIFIGMKKLLKKIL